MNRILFYLVALLALVLVTAPFGHLIQAQQPPLVFASKACTFGLAVTSTGESVLATTPGITTRGSQTVRLMAQVMWIPATNTTSLTFNIRRGTATTGATVITPTTVSSTGGPAAAYAFFVEDAPGEVAGQQYSLTVTPTGATANSTANTCELIAVTY